MSRIERYQQQLRDDETPDPEPLEAQELHDVWERGNKRRPVPPNLSHRYKAELVDLEQRWKDFAASLGKPWKPLIKSLTFENKGLGESFMHYLKKRADLDGKPFTAQSAVRVRTRQLGSLYRKYTARRPERPLMDHLRDLILVSHTRKWGLRREPKLKPTMGVDFFLNHIHFRWVRDTTALGLGLDRIDDVCLRLFYMWTGCRKHELVYAKPRDLKKKVQQYDDESDAYTDIECNTDTQVGPWKKCWVCGQRDEREQNPKLKVLCWEDIDLWILHDPEGNGGRDKLSMQVLLRWHKGENRQITPTWCLFIEENLPFICPISHILAKALAEGVVANEGYQTRAEPFFNTKLNKRALKIRWKKEWMHKPVFRKTEKTSRERSRTGEENAELNASKDGEGPNDRERARALGDEIMVLRKKSDEAQSAGVFDARSERLRIAMGLLERLAQYCSRRGYAECVDTNYRRSVRDQGLRHRPNSSVYQTAYHNAMMNAVVQDAFLDRGTKSPYLAILNHMGLRLDENAPKRVSDEMMRAIGPNAAVRRLEQQMEALQAELRLKYGRPSRATGDDKRRYESLQARLSAARQRHRRKVFRVIYADHFVESDENELQKQLQGIHEPVVTRQVTHSLPERQVLADILGDMDEDMSEEEIVKRKVEAINAMVAYAFKSDPAKRAEPEHRAEPVPTLSSEVVLPMPARHPITANTEPVPMLPLPSSEVVLPMPARQSIATMTEPAPSGSIRFTPEILSDSPPPPYSEVARAEHRQTSAPRTIAVAVRRRSPYTRKRPDPCIFCGKTFTRTEGMWDHLEHHLELAKGGPLACPRLECKGMVLDNTECFKAHASRVHGSSFRVKIKLVSRSSVRSVETPTRSRIILASGNKVRPPGDVQPSPRPRIVLVRSQGKESSSR